jgi:hypothetical protein
MSIATLKKKTQAKYSHNMSTGHSGFSLNGTHRNQGYVGQTSLSRSLPRTLAKGLALKGHGGCSGTYPVNPPILSTVTSTEDNSVVKTSTLGTKGMLDTKYRWIRRPQPFSSIGLKQIDQSDYLKYLKKKTIRDNTSDSTCKHIQSDGCTISKCKYVSYKESQIVHKPDSDYLPISQEEYIQNKIGQCAQLDISSIYAPKSSTSGIMFSTCNNYPPK